MIKRFKHLKNFIRTMSALLPPENVRGMIECDPKAFSKTLSVPTIDLSTVDTPWSKILPCLKKNLLKMDNLKPVITTEDKKVILLNPDKIQTFNDLETYELEKLGVYESNFKQQDIVLNYENWKADEILKAVLPLDQEGLTSFSRIGHIVHVNLRDHLIPYKSLIGKVLLDKCANCRTVVNKTQNIDNTYRFFQMELLCGENDFLVQVKEHGIAFEFDFSSVYWNPRLSSEHDRLVKKLKTGDVLYDACAGVGPFSIPAAKKKCIVLANDLNPVSYKWLKHNAEKNKVTNIQCFNKDAREFLRVDMKNDLKQRWLDNFQNTTHITMNLPAMAVEFLDVFNGLFNTDLNLLNKDNISLPIVHVYCFVKAEEGHADLAKALVEQHLGFELGNNVQEVFFVRNVSPNKEMIRVSFQLTRDILFCTTNLKRKASGLPADRDEADCINSKKKCNKIFIFHHSYQWKIYFKLFLINLYSCPI